MTCQLFFFRFFWSCVFFANLFTDEPTLPGRRQAGRRPDRATRGLRRHLHGGEWRERRTLWVVRGRGTRHPPPRQWLPIGPPERRAGRCGFDDALHDVQQMLKQRITHVRRPFDENFGWTHDSTPCRNIFRCFFRSVGARSFVQHFRYIPSLPPSLPPRGGRHPDRACTTPRSGVPHPADEAAGARRNHTRVVIDALRHREGRLGLCR